jgi:putative PIG3 family NAD(P)H quinone oxidoreductase
LIDVHATAVNRADLLQARGLYPPPDEESAILGLEAAGRVAAVGPEVDAWVPGDRVCALTPGGSYAEQVVVPQGWLIPLPPDWSFAEGAAVPEAWLTAYSNLWLEGKLEAGETALIHAGASGVGVAAIQIARELGAYVVATAGSEAKCARCRALGAQLALNYHQEQFRTAIHSQTPSAGIDLVLDCVGGPYLSQHLEVLRPGGRLILIGVLGGGQGTIDLANVLMKSLKIIGTRLRARNRQTKDAICQGFRDRIWPLLAAGKCQPIIDSRFPITDVAAAHQHVAQNLNIGKVILEIRTEAKP